MIGCGNCQSCYKTSCAGHNPGFGFSIPSGGLPTGSSGGLLSSLTSINGMINTATSFIPGGQLVGSLITSVGRLLGIAPRGDHQKFLRTAYPYMRTAAAQTSLSVFTWWFGEVIEVKPDGSYQVKFSKDVTNTFDLSGPMTGINESIRRLDAEGRAYYYTTCQRADGDCVNHPSEYGFELHGDPGILAEIFGTTPEEILPSTTRPTGTNPQPTNYPYGGAPRPASEAGILSGNNTLIILLGLGALAMVALTPKGRKQ